MPNTVETSTSQEYVGLLLYALACVLGAAAVMFSPIIIWPAAVEGLLPFSFATTAWLEIASLPGCILLGVLASLVWALGSQTKGAS